MIVMVTVLGDLSKICLISFSYSKPTNILSDKYNSKFVQFSLIFLQPIERGDNPAF